MSAGVEKPKPTPKQDEQERYEKRWREDQSGPRDPYQDPIRPPDKW